MNLQEIEESEFNRMSPGDEAAWQHAHGMRCSFDCAACDVDVSGEWVTPSTAARLIAPNTSTSADPWFQG